MAGIKVRKAEKKDFKQVAALCEQLGYHYPMKSIKKKFRKVSKSKNEALLVACEGKSVLGWTHISIYNMIYYQKLGNILGLIVDQNARGKGAGKLLMAAAEKWAKKKGCAGVIVNSAESRKDAHTFYEKIGYRLVKRQERYYKEVVETSEPAASGS